MPEIRVTLSIGYPTASHEDTIEIPEDEWCECENQESKDDLMYKYWQEWADCYIEGRYELV